MKTKERRVDKPSFYMVFLGEGVRLTELDFDFLLLLCCCDSFSHLFSSFGVLSFYTLVGALPCLAVLSWRPLRCQSVKDVGNIKERERVREKHVCLPPCGYGSSPRCRTAEDTLIRC
uniref:Uncharacterized protein n=1 Tax=Aegilops tauschii subsp. strangulata TaxID=200361 RepID=A0A453KR58_AEGTS